MKESKDLSANIEGKHLILFSGREETLRRGEGGGKKKVKENMIM